MIKRSRGIFEAGYYLSKYTRQQGETDKLIPPVALKTELWAEVYRMFYPKLANGRTVDVFHNSLKNTRDNYDSYTGTGRIGWREKEDQDGSTKRKPRPLSKLASEVFQDLERMTEDNVWAVVEKYVTFDFQNMDPDWLPVIEMELEQQQGIDLLESCTEGGVKVGQSLMAERCGHLPKKAKKLQGYRCRVCGFDYEKAYGDWGCEYIHVHHLQPLGDGTVRATDPQNDLAVVCANCHAMIHRKKGITLTLNELKTKMINAQREAEQEGAGLPSSSPS